MSSKTTLTEGSPLGTDKRRQTQQGLGSLWSSQDEMKRYVSKLKSELDEQKSRVRRVHRDKAEEIKRLHENLDNEKQKAIENVAKRLESDKVYELKKLREAVVKQKESELRQVLRLKDEEMRTLKQELQESKNETRILELENKRVLNERAKGDTNDLERRLRNEVTALRHDKRRLEESLRIKSEADFEKGEIIRKMKYEHENEVQRLTRESKRESLKEFRHLKAVSREIEAKNHQLAAKDLEMRRLEEERNALGNELNLRRKNVVPNSNLRKSNSFHLQKQNGLSVSQISESDFEKAAEDKIKKLKMRNSELVAIARKLEEKAKQLQEEKEILEKSSELSPEIGNLKKAFARQRAKDLAEHAKLLMSKEHEISSLKKEVLQGSCNGFVDNENVNDLKKIVQQTAKERLLLEKQLSSKEEVWTDEIQEMNSRNQKLSHDKEILKEELCKLHDVEAKHFKAVFEMNEIRGELKKLQHASSEKDKRMFKLELEKQTYVAKNNALQKTNNELSHKIDQLRKLEDECTTLKNNLESLEHDYDLLKAENRKLHSQIESLCALRQEVDRLRQENLGLQSEKEDFLLKLEEREKEISCLHTAQDEAQKEHNEQVSELDEMVRRLKEQCDENVGDKNVKFVDGSLDFPVMSSTPKFAKFTQTSRPSSPTLSPLSPINDHLSGNLQEEAADDLPFPTQAYNHVQHSLLIPSDGTSSSTSFDIEKAATRIDQLAASDSDETDFHNNQQKTDHPVTYNSSSEISDVSEEEENDNNTSEDTSYSADVSRVSDFEEQQRTNENDKKEVKNGNNGGDENVFIGNQLQNEPDVEEKLSIFIAKYSYDPMLYSPNDNPETELAFQAGDYLYVYGDVDEDGFFVGELMSGERGLVPSNFVERIAEEDEAILKESDERDVEDESEDESSEEEIILKDEDGKRKVIRPKPFSERRHEMFRTSLDHVLNDQLGDIRESEEEDLVSSSLSEDDVAVKKRHNKKTEVDLNLSDGLDSVDSGPSPPRVPSPSKLCLDRQFTKSALISWRGASLPSDEIQGYNVYVDGKLKTQIKGSNKTNILVEGIDPTETYRLSVRTKSVDGQESPDHEATMVFGPDAKLSPYNLRMLKITQTSAEIQWVPANSSYAHEVFLEDSLLQCVKPGICTYMFNELSPSALYRIRIRTQIPSHLRLAMGKASTDENLSSEVEFTTLAGGLPEPPVDLRIEQQTPEKIILAWLPVTISPAGYSNGFRVSGYKVYVNGIYCTETDSSSVDSVSIPAERLRNLGKRHDFTRMRFVVRTLSVLGESADSNIVEVESQEASCTQASLPPLEALRSEGNKVKTITETAAEGICETDTKQTLLNASAVDENNARLTNYNVLSSLEPQMTISHKLATSSDVEKQLNESHSVPEPRLVAAATGTEINTKDDELEEGHGNFLVETREQVYQRDQDSEYTSEEHQDEPRSAVDAGSVTDSNEENSKVTEQEIVKSDIISETRDALPTEGRRKPIVVRYDIEDDETETESCTAESKTETEEESVELFVDLKTTEKESEAGGGLEQVKKLEQSAVVENETGAPNIHVTTAEEQQSESETDTEYGPLLSVIDEVDEENLTETSNNSFIQKTENTSNSEASVVYKDQRNSTLSNPSKTLSESKSGTLSSEDGGFTTDDDVLDLLDDDDDLVRKTEDKPSESKVSAGTKQVTDDTLLLPTVGEDAENELVNGLSSQCQENKTTDPNTSSNNDVQSFAENQETRSSSTVSEKVEASESTTGEESNGDVSELSYPTRTSLNSDSSLSISDAPPPPDEAINTIINTLSLPDNREQRSGESDLNDNQNRGTRSEGVPDIRSESCRSESEAGENTSELIRYFVALYNYDPYSMSPNADAADEELPFKEGDLIKVFGDKDDDGFFWGECKRKQGFVPSNMVSEITIDEAEDLFNEATNSVRSFDAANKVTDERINGDSELDVDVISGDYIRRISSEGIDLKDKLAFWETMENGDLGPRKMRALFDYDPNKDSPNVDSEVELKFKTGEFIYVFGDMDDDGFFQGELRGIRGLVPSNFLEPVKDAAHENEDNIETSKLGTSPAKEPSQENQSTVLSDNLPNETTNEQEDQQRKKKGIFSKGKKIFKKAFR